MSDSTELEREFAPTPMDPSERIRVLEAALGEQELRRALLHGLAHVENCL